MRYFLSFLFLLFIITGKADTVQMVRYGIDEGLSDEHVTGILQDDEGMVWMSTWNGLNRFDGYNFARVGSTGPAVLHIKNMFLGRDGNIWCSMDGDRYYCFILKDYTWKSVDSKQWQTEQRYSKNTWTKLTERDSLVLRQAGLADESYIRRDRQGNIWVVFHYDGVAKLVHNYRPATSFAGIEHVNARAIMTDAQGRIWLATKEDKCLRLCHGDGTLMGWINSNGKLSRKSVPFGAMAYCLLEDKKGHVWIGTKHDGLFRLTPADNETWHIQRIDIGAESIYDLAQDDRERIWVGTQKEGLLLIEKPYSENPYSIIPKGYPTENGRFVRKLLVGSNGVLFCATNNGLVTSRLKDKEMTFALHQHHPERANSLSGYPVVQLAEGESGEIYVCSNCGIDRVTSANGTYNDSQFEQIYHSENILVSMAVHANKIIAVNNNNVALLNTDGHEVATLNTNYWTKQCRFSEATPLRLADGRWIFGHEDGTFVSDEQDWTAKYQLPRIVFSSLRKANEAIDVSVVVCDTLVLEPQNRQFSLTYATLDYADNSHIRYRTRLDDGQWNNMGTNRVITFFDMHPGNHILQVQSTDAYGRWSDYTKTMIIIVKPTFWETPWATLLYVLLIIIVAVAIAYTIFYIRSLRRQQQETLESYLALLEKNHNAEHQHVVQNDDKIADEPKNKVIKNQFDEAFMRRVIKYVEANLANSDANVTDMASAAAVSSASLYRKMNTLLGVSPANFLQEARLTHAAKLLLKEDNVSVADVACKCGFDNRKYFSKCFKKRYGMSPSDYRSLHLREIVDKRTD